MKKAEATRHNILLHAFELIYANGYNNTSIDDILATTNVTKGAFYYHFKNKDEMGLAIINEILKPSLDSSFAGPLEKKDNPAEAVYTMIKQLLTNEDFMKVEFGCPVSNLTQETAASNDVFADALENLTSQWRDLLVEKINKGKREGFIRKDVDAREVALFVMSGYWGIRSFGKLSGKEIYKPFLKALKKYLASLQ